VKGRIQKEPIDISDPFRGRDHSIGAVVTFQGVVRSTEASRELKHLFYEADERLASDEMNKVLEEAVTKYKLIDAIAVHRIGVIKPGETSLFVAVGSTHRKEGFEACDYIVDSIKERLPIWKKDHFVDGTESWH
jgi:molybdopterin synthase catalytic subunit